MLDYNTRCALQVICHGIPDKRPLQDGDIINVDVSVFLNGYHGDLNETYVVGDGVDEESKKLIRATSEVSHHANESPRAQSDILAVKRAGCFDCNLHF